MGRLMNVGYGNVVNTDKVVAVISSDSAPARRMIQSAKDQGKAIDATQGRKTKSVIITDGVMIVLSALSPDTISARFKEDEAVSSWKGENHDE